MKRMIKWLVMAGILLLPAHTEAQNSILKGRIYNAGNFESVAFATVTVKNGEGAIVAVITTGYDGKYQTDSLDAGAYRVEVFSKEYKTFSMDNIALQERKAAVIDVALINTTEDEESSRQKPKILEKVFGGIFKAAITAL